MRSTIITLFFFLFLSLDLFFLTFELDSLRMFSKTLLIPILIYSHYSSTKISNLLLFGLVASWFGDIALLFDGMIYFIIGLGSFLIGHLFFSFQFRKLPQFKKSNKEKLVIALVLFLIATIYLVFIRPFAAELFIPVLLYVITIAFMVYNAFVQKSSHLITIGAVFFLVSDSILGMKVFNAFNFPLSEIVIMATYGMAQFLIVKGVNSSSSPNN